MRKRELLLIVITLMFIFNEVEAQISTTVPAEVETWISSRLQSSGNKRPITNYNDDDQFFSTDSATVVGYLKGYKPTEGFKTGLVYMENEFSRVDYPMVVKIFNDGRFEARIPAWYPKVLEVVFNDHWLYCYVEPGQTLAVVIDWTGFKRDEKDLNTVQFYGPLANINRDRNSIPILKTDDDWLNKQVRKVKPQQFKQETLHAWDIQKTKLDSILHVRKVDEKSKALAHAELNINMLMRLHDYVALREDERRSDSSDSVLQTPLPADYYDFINRIHPNDNTIFIPEKFAWFLNRMEYGPLVKAFNLPDDELWISGLEKVVRLDKARDSIAFNELYLKYGKIYDIIRLHRVASAFKFELRSVGSDSLINYLKTVKGTLYNSFYQRQGEIILEETLQRKDKKGTALPDSYAGTLFKKLIAPYAGKMIFVDFWAMSCAPCINDIQQLYATRAKYEDNTDFIFLFITSEDESPKRAYQSFIKKQQLANTVYLNSDDYRYLRALFEFSAIPSYAIISKEGRVVNKNSEPHDFMLEIEKFRSQQAY